MEQIWGSNVRTSRTFVHRERQSDSRTDPAILAGQKLKNPHKKQPKHNVPCQFVQRREGERTNARNMIKPTHVPHG